MVGDSGVPVACENALSRYDKEGYERIQEVAADNKIDYFTYLRLDGVLMTEPNFDEFENLVGKMNGTCELSKGC